MMDIDPKDMEFDGKKNIKKERKTKNMLWENILQEESKMKENTWVKLPKNILEKH